ncbi:Lin1244/Lin1753 domain-containing protein [Caloramator australicus]|uniref:DnaD domain protein n=1 Tax=Caloramator australicus RC3 TaxID=857293 RepID=I7LIE2_9CLOT|nr:Lin1244/Lin1753 domain-containing protein [Caloramator australicus]CCJ32867.1 hypothetical protein CAAU_0783 [Caloramator australicus RC3]
MARPKKQTIEYFPHFVNHHKTMFILESKYGNDGYAFWFKLLEILGSTNGMYYDCKNIANWEFLLAKTHLDEETANNILNTLADLNAIDSELWGKARIIWSQNLVDNVKDAFKKRVSEMPKKPTIDDKNSNYEEFPEYNSEFPERKPSLNDVSGDGNGERKEKERKEKESKRENNNFRNENSHLNNENENKNLNNSLSLDKNTIELCKYYEQLRPGESISAHFSKLQILIQEYGMEWVKEALERTIKNKNKFILSYMEAILKNWQSEGKEDTYAPNKRKNKSNNPEDEVIYDFSKYGG